MKIRTYLIFMYLDFDVVFIPESYVCLYKGNTTAHTPDYGARRVSGLRRKPAQNVHRTAAQNSQREGRSLPRQGRDHLLQ